MDDRVGPDDWASPHDRVSSGDPAEPPERRSPGPGSDGSGSEQPPDASGAAPPPSAVTPPPAEAFRRPVRVEPVPGTPYGLAILGFPGGTSGPAIGSLVAGIAGVLVSLAVCCLGTVGAEPGWGGWVAGAFGVLAVVLSGAAIGLGAVGWRRTRLHRPGQPAVSGGSLAVSGMICGGVGMLFAFCGVGAALLLQAT